MNCQQCGAQLDPGTTVCPNCGKNNGQSILKTNITIPPIPKGAFKGHLFSFRGRAKRLEFWLSLIASLILVQGLLGIFAAAISDSDSDSGPYVLGVVFAIIFILLSISMLAVSVRRLHDLGLSGFWFAYLSSMGLPVLYLFYLLDLDESSKRVVDKVWNTGHPWLSWIITTLFWWIGAPVCLILLFMTEGKHEDNEYGPNPYKD